MGVKIEEPVGDKDGANVTFETSGRYAPKSLTAWINGKQVAITEVSSTVFDLPFPVDGTDTIIIRFLEY